MSITLEQMKYGGLGKYRTLLFSKSVSNMTDKEHKKFSRICAYVDEKFADCYNPLRVGPEYICFSCHLGDTGLTEKHESAKYYNLTIKIQSYTFNDKMKLRLVLNESNLTQSPLRPVEYTDVEMPELE